MSNVTLKLEGFAGGEISDVLTDATHVAQRVGCWVEININGIDVLISSTDLPAWIVRNYEIARERGATFVSANVIPDPRPATPKPEAPHDR